MAGTEHNIITIPPELPLIALKNTVLFPKTVIPLIVQRPKSVNALQAAMDKHRLVLFVTQKNIEDDSMPASRAEDERQGAWAQMFFRQEVHKCFLFQFDRCKDLRRRMELPAHFGE